MKCKFCEAQLEAEDQICPNCGGVNNAEAEDMQPAEPVVTEETQPVTADEAAAQESAQHSAAAPAKVKTWLVILVTAVSVLLVVGLVFVVLFGAGILKMNADPTVPTQAPTENPLQGVVSYTGDDEKAAAAAGDVVATIGQQQLTNGELQVYYWMGVYDFLNENSAYLSYFGIDLNKGFDQQLYNAEDKTTWQKAFLDSAINTWNQYAAIALYAKNNGYVYDPEVIAHAATFTEMTEEMAKEYGYENALQMLTKEIGPGATVDGYIHFREAELYAYEYLNDFYDTVNPTLEEMEAYYTAHESDFTAGGYGKEKGDVVDIRHILFVPEGGEKNESGVTEYKEEAYQACLAKAQEVYQKWTDGAADEAYFAQLAAEYSVDGSAQNGGLIPEIFAGQTVQAFDAWIFDESRREGDTEIVKTEYGYHIIYFVDRDPAWQRMARDGVISQKMSEMIDQALKTYPAAVDYDQIVLGEVDLV